LLNKATGSESSFNSLIFGEKISCLSSGGILTLRMGRKLHNIFIYIWILAKSPNDMSTIFIIIIHSTHTYIITLTNYIIYTTNIVILDLKCTIYIPCNTSRLQFHTLYLLPTLYFTFTNKCTVFYL